MHVASFLPWSLRKTTVDFLLVVFGFCGSLVNNTKLKAISAHGAFGFVTAVAGCMVWFVDFFGVDDIFVMFLAQVLSWGLQFRLGEII